MDCRSLFVGCGPAPYPADVTRGRGSIPVCGSLLVLCYCDAHSMLLGFSFVWALFF